MAYASKFSSLAHLELVVAQGLDRLNPVTLRQIRQHLRSPVIAGVLVLLLMLCVIAAIVAATTTLNPSSGVPFLRVQLQRGELLFLLVVALWSAVAWVAQPVMFIATVRAEREDHAWELLDLTGLNPLRILGGVLCAAAIQQLLLLAVMGPFLVLAWLLNGLDPLVIALALLLIPLTGLVSVCVGIKSSITSKRGAFGGRPGRMAIGAGLGWLLTMYLLWLSLSLPQMIPGAPSLRALSTTTVVTLLLLANGALHLGAGALVDAAMRLTHPAQERSRVPRLLVLAFLMNLGVVLALLALSGVLFWELAGAWFALIAVGWNAFASIDGFAEPYRLTRRQTQVSAGYSRVGRWFFAPGASAARRFHLTIALPAMIVGITCWIADYRHLQELRVIGALTVGVECYALIILTLSDLIARGGDPALANPERHRRWVWLILIVGTLLGGFLGVVTKGSAVFASCSALFGLIPFALTASGIVEKDVPVAVVLICIAAFFALLVTIREARNNLDIRPLPGKAP